MDYNETFTEPKAPTKDAFTFKAWYTDKELTQVYDFSTPATSDIVLYADWKALPVTPDKPTSPKLPETGVASYNLASLVIILGGLVMTYGMIDRKIKK